MNLANEPYEDELAEESRHYGATPYREEGPDDYEDGLSDVEADAMTLRDAGMGTDESRSW